jgi:ketosteroid isomerase-like protein
MTRHSGFLAAVATLAAIEGSTIAGAQQSSVSVTAEIQAVENEWAKASRTKDASILERILSEEYTYFGVEAGTQLSKQGMIQALKQSKASFSSIENIVRSVRVYGDIAIVLGEFHGSGTEDGKAFLWRDSWQTIFAKRNGKWVAIASHEAPIPAARR